MKIYRMLFTSLLVLLGVATAAAGEPAAAPAREVEVAFARLKSLAGEWEGASVMGKGQSGVSYRVVSGGTAAA